jgi:hypothetical protein
MADSNSDSNRDEDQPSFYGRMNRNYVGLPNYQRVWQACVSADIPAVRVDSRWRVGAGAEKAAVALFGLRRKQPAAA